MATPQAGMLGMDRQMKVRLEKAADLVEKRHKDSVLLDKEAEDKVPLFDFDGKFTNSMRNIMVSFLFNQET